MTDTTRWPKLNRSLVAILRGITAPEADAISDVLIAEGFEALEVPLNSPDPLVTIGRMVRRHGANALIGGGTMLSVDHVDQVADQGGRLMVSPNMRPAVIRHAVARGMVTMPGVLTPTEAFDALDAGAAGLKFFPASVMGVAGISALMAVLPKGTVVGAVGGVGVDNMADYARAGVRAFGLGTAIFRPGDTADDVRRNARALVAAYDLALGN
jgi:2-dehydro-3-deoxyphosphogalactonate aldolase